MICTQSLWEQVCAQPGSAVLDFEEKPLLVIEVTSQNWRDDYIRKRAEYDLIDIPEYWIVDANQPKIRVCSRPENEGSYSHQEFLPGQQVQSVQFAEFILSVNQVLCPPLVEDLIREEQAQLQQLEQQNQELGQQVERLAQRLREMGVDMDSEL